MTGLRGWGLPEQHLALDALVAFVDGELSPNARDRAAAHLAHCPSCASDASSQRQARAAVQSAECPSISSGLMQALQAIPSSAELPERPDELGMSEDGQLVAIDRTRTPGKTSALGSEPRLGDGHSFGRGSALGAETPGKTAERPAGRRARQGAGVVFSGFVLGALAMMNLPAEEEQDYPANGQLPDRGPQDQTVLPASAQASTEAAPSSQPQVAANTATTLPSPSPTSLIPQP